MLLWQSICNVNATIATVLFGGWKKHAAWVTLVIVEMLYVRHLTVLSIEEWGWEKAPGPFFLFVGGMMVIVIQLKYIFAVGEEYYRLKDKR